MFGFVQCIFISGAQFPAGPFDEPDDDAGRGRGTAGTPALSLLTRGAG